MTRYHVAYRKSPDGPLNHIAFDTAVQRVIWIVTYGAYVEIVSETCSHS